MMGSVMDRMDVRGVLSGMAVAALVALFLRFGGIVEGVTST